MADSPPELPKWDSSHLGLEPFAGVFTSSRRGGKTHALMDLYQRQLHKHHNITIVFTTGVSVAIWEQVIPGEGAVLIGYQPRVLVRAEERNFAKQSEGAPMDRYLFIFDDITDIAKEPLVSDLFARGRHWGASIAICTQHPSMISPAMRENIDLAVILQTKSASSREYLIKDLLSQTLDLAQYGMDTTRSQRVYWNKVLTKLAPARQKNGAKGAALVIDWLAPEDDALYTWRAGKLKSFSTSPSTTL